MADAKMADAQASATKSGISIESYDFKPVQAIDEKGEEIPHNETTDEDVFRASVAKLELFSRKRKRPEKEVEKEDEQQKKATAEAFEQLNTIRRELTEAKGELNVLINLIEYSSSKAKEEKFLTTESVPRRTAAAAASAKMLSTHLEAKQQQLTNAAAILRKGAENVSKSLEQQRAFFKNLTKLRQHWRVYAPLHRKRPSEKSNPMPLHAGEPLVIDCSYASAGSTFVPPTRYGSLDEQSEAELLQDDKGSVYVQAPPALEPSTLQFTLISRDAQLQSSHATSSFCLPMRMQASAMNRELRLNLSGSNDVWGKSPAELDACNQQMLSSVRATLFYRELFGTIMQEAERSNALWLATNQSSHTSSRREGGEGSQGVGRGIAIEQVLDDEVRVAVGESHTLAIKLISGNAVESEEDKGGTEPQLCRLAGVHLLRQLFARLRQAQTQEQSVMRNQQILLQSRLSITAVAPAFSQTGKRLLPTLPQAGAGERPSRMLVSVVGMLAHQLVVRRVQAVVDAIVACLLNPSNTSSSSSSSSSGGGGGGGGGGCSIRLWCRWSSDQPTFSSAVLGACVDFTQPMLRSHATSTGASGASAGAVGAGAGNDASGVLPLESLELSGEALCVRGRLLSRRDHGSPGGNAPVFASTGAGAGAGVGTGAEGESEDASGSGATETTTATAGLLAPSPATTPLALDGLGEYLATFACACYVEAVKEMLWSLAGVQCEISANRLSATIYGSSATAATSTSADCIVLSFLPSTATANAVAAAASKRAAMGAAMGKQSHSDGATKGTDGDGAGVGARAEAAMSSAVSAAGPAPALVSVECRVAGKSLRQQLASGGVKISEGADATADSVGGDRQLVCVDWSTVPCNFDGKCGCANDTIMLRLLWVIQQAGWRA